MALTFDDGPDGRCTEGVLDVLAAAHAPATFFLVGANVDRGEDDALLARMVREGHALGTHGYWHDAMRRVFFSDLTAQDIHATTDAIDHALWRAGVEPVPVPFYRPPFGILTAPTQRGAHATGVALVRWTVSVGDWPQARHADQIVAPILARVQAGDVIVLHDGTPLTPNSQAACVEHPSLAAALRELIPALRARGLEPAPLAQVLDLGFDSARAGSLNPIR